MDRLTIPVQATVTVPLTVFLTPDPASALSPGQVTEAAGRWVEQYADEPLRSAIRAFLKRGSLDIEVWTPDQVPLPLQEQLAHMGMGEVEARRMKLATHVLLVAVDERNVHPRIGLLTAIAAARATASQLRAVIYEPGTPRVHPISSYTRSLPGDARVAVGDHIFVPFSVGKVGLGWMTTRGMATFGLPDLEINEVPPNLDRLYLVVNAVAQRLVDAVLSDGAQREEAFDVLQLEDELIITNRDIATASGREFPAGQALRSTRVRLVLGQATAQRAPMITIRPPAAFCGETGVWANSALAELLGTQEAIHHHVPNTDAGMEAAHRRATAEFPGVKDRFRRGLPPGETLYVKHGFETQTRQRWFGWIVVVRWSGRRIDAQLASVPLDTLLATLQLGQHLTLDEAEVFDWMIERADGSQEGGYTRQAALDQRH